MTLFSKAPVFTYPDWKRSVFKTMRFQKAPLLKPFLKTSVFIIVFDRLLLVWMMGESALKSTRFQTITHLVWSVPTIRANLHFTITGEILARSLANFHCQ